jgi:hypothetical protein
VDRYIGLDAHASSCTLAVVSGSGKRIGTQVVETNARCLIDAVRQIPKPRYICLEEGTLSEWLYEVLSPHAEEVAAGGGAGEPRAEGRPAGRLWTGRSAASGRNSAEGLRGDEAGRLPEAASARGAATGGGAVRGTGRPGGPAASSEEGHADEAKRHAEYRLVRSCPGLGPVRSAELLPIVMTPFRFQSKRGFWAYCGLGIVQRSSSDWVRAASGEWTRASVQQTRGLNRQFNHALKAI